MKSYLVCKDEALSVLEEKVCSLVLKGYVAIGGITAIDDGYGYTLLQAMVLKPTTEE